MSGTPIGSWSETGADGLYDNINLSLSADEGILVWDVIEQKWKIDKTGTLTNSHPPGKEMNGMKWDPTLQMWKGNDAEIAQVDWGDK